MDGGLRHWLRAVHVPTFICVCLFAISSWIDINGVWVEVPLLVSQLPESWNLPSYLVVIIQVANVGPLAYTVARKLAPDRVSEPPVVYAIIAVGAVSCVLLAFFWSETTYIGGTLHSTALLTLCAFLSLVDCTSSVVYLPYMAAFRAQYLTAFYVGEGLSGLLPALIGLAQGVGRDPVCRNESVNDDDAWNATLDGDGSFRIVPYYYPPNFSVGVFFAILCGFICVSGVAFSVINFHPRCRQERVEKISVDEATGDAVRVVTVGGDACRVSGSGDDGAVKKSSSGSGGVDVVINGGSGIVTMACSCDPAALTVVADTPEVGRDEMELRRVRAMETLMTLTSRSSSSSSTSEIRGVNPAIGEHSSSCGLEAINQVGDLPRKSGSVANAKLQADGKGPGYSFAVEQEASRLDKDSKSSSQTLTSFVALLLIVGWSNALTNGVLPSLQTYSCLPYGNLAYNLSVRLSVVANPLACFLALFVMARSLWTLATLTVLASLLAVYHVVLAALSPSPPLRDEDIGIALAVVTFVLLTGLFSYVKVCAAALFNETSGSAGLLWCGCSTQIGSLVGAVVTFLLVNVFQLFTSSYPCSTY